MRVCKGLWLFGLLLSGVVAWGSGAAAEQPALIVNIDNPQFRKLVIAVPALAVPAGADEETKKLAAQGADELSRLMNFSGLFNVMGNAAYAELMPSQSQLAVAGDSPKRGLDGIDIPQWKAIGVESLTLGEITKAGATYVVAMRTADIYRGKLVLGKKYSNVKASELNAVMRKYADQLLKEYTGKPGIFTSRLVFVGRRQKGAYKQVFISDFDGSNVVQITSSSSPNLSPTWSPDGKFVTYTSYRDGNPDLWMYELASGKTSKLSSRKGLNSGSNWSHNGRLIAFTGSHNGDTDIFTLTPDGKNLSRLIGGAGLDVDPTFSPNGQWMAFVSGRFGNPHIFLATLKWDSADKVKVAEKDKRLTYAGWYNATPAWAPESDKIVFAGYDRDIDRFDLFMMNPDGTQLERLTIRAGDNERPSWSPNGQLLVFQSNRTKGRDVKSVYQLYVMNRDGSGQRPLHTGLYETETPSWSPAAP